MAEIKQTLWVSALIPAEGADCYDGVRVQVSETELEAYQDLAEWLDLQDEDGDSAGNEDDIELIKTALDESELVDTWKVERQDIYA